MLNRLSSDTRVPGFVIALASLIFLFAEIANDHFWLSDLEVYYKAATRITDGITLYRHPDEIHYVFKYSPVSAIFFIPLTVVSFSIAKVIYWLLLTAVIIYGFQAAIKLSRPGLLNEDPKAYNRIFLAAILVMAIHFLRELHLGQVNNLLCVAYLVMFSMLIQGKHRVAGLLFAGTFYMKPFSLIFMPWFIYKRQWKLIGWSLLWGVIMGAAPYFFTFDVQHYISEYAGWLNELKIEMAWKQGLLTYGNLTVFSVIARYTPLGYMVYWEHGTLLFQLIILAAMGLAYLYYFNQSDGSNDSVYADLALLTATIPLLAYTSANAYLFTGPAVIYLLCHWKKLAPHLKYAAVLAFVLIGINFAEVIGKKMSQAFDRYSLITIGAVILVTVMIAARRHINRQA